MKEDLALLASPADIQLAFLRDFFGLPKDIELDETFNVAELALQYNDIAGAAGDMLECGEINISLYDMAVRLDHYLDEMSGREHATLWTPAGLSSSVEWHEVRGLAREALKMFP